MIAICEPEDWDYLAALLSGDWFRERWSEVGLQADPAVHAGARKIVEDYLNGKTRIIQIDHSEERSQRTRSELELLAKKYPKVGLGVILNPHNLENPRLFWLLETLTLKVATNYPIDPASNWLPPHVLVAIHYSFEKTLDASPPLDLEADFLRSRTHWDLKLQNLVEDSPMWLTDWLQARSYVSSRFEAYWKTLSGQLDTESQELVRSWYESEIHGLSDDPDLRIPVWMREPKMN